MPFAHDTEVALATTVALVNTLDDRGSDELTTLADLDEFLQRWEFSGRRDHSAAELEAVRGLRPVLRSLWLATEDHVAGTVNELLSEAKALPRLVKHDQWDWHLHATDPEAPLADRIAVEAAMAFVDVMRSGELDRLRVCAGVDCDHVLVDLSRNRSRQYCESGCGNRAHVAAYRARTAAPG